jgi:hypothetical protein
MRYPALSRRSLPLLREGGYLSLQLSFSRAKFRCEGMNIAASFHVRLMAREFFD